LICDGKLIFVEDGVTFNGNVTNEWDVEDNGMTFIGVVDEIVDGISSGAAGCPEVTVSLSYSAFSCPRKRSLSASEAFRIRSA